MLGLWLDDSDQAEVKTPHLALPSLALVFHFITNADMLIKKPYKL
jgi:hypothetical protein